MSTQSRLLRGGARAAVGLIVVGVAASAVLLLNNATLPAVAREPLAITVDTTLDTARTLVCAGSFTELGADPSRPGVAIPTGAPAVTIAGKAEASTELTRVENGTGLPTVLTSPADVPLGAAQIQAVTTEVLRGTAASSCTEPVNEQWLLGGSTTLGVSTTLSLANPGKVPATVQITVNLINNQRDRSKNHQLAYLDYAQQNSLYPATDQGADVILMPEVPFSYESICAKVAQREQRGRRFTIVIVADNNFGSFQRTQLVELRWRP